MPDGLEAFESLNRKFSNGRLHICEMCAASFNDDNSFAEHLGRHRKIMRGDGTENDRWTNERQASRAQVDDLRDMLEELRG
jgi:hypothetical protein